MSLRRTTLLTLIGVGYTVAHKIALGIFPVLRISPMGQRLMPILWLISTLTLILFAFQFLQELSPRNKGLRYSLVSIIIFTGLVILSHLPLPLMAERGLTYRLVFGLSVLCNAMAIMIFLISFKRLVARNSPLYIPVRGFIWGIGGMITLRLVSMIYFLIYLWSGRELDPTIFMKPLSTLVFLLTYGMMIWKSSRSGFGGWIAITSLWIGKVLYAV